MELNKDQAAAVDAALDGHSVFITGQAGTGKTATVKAIISGLNEKEKRVLVCCATGIASVPLQKEGAQTVHRAFGLLNGRYSLLQMTNLFSDGTDKNYEQKKSRIEEADVLVIDEIR